MENLIFLKIGILALLTISVIIREKGIKFYHPAILVSIIYFFEFGFPNILMITDPFKFWYFYNLSYKALDKGLTFIILVFILFILGYYAPYYSKLFKNLVLYLVNKLPKVHNYTIKIKNLPLVLLLLIIGGWIARIIVFKIGAYYHTEVGYNPIKRLEGFELIAQYISIASMFPTIALSLCFIEWLKNQSKKNYLLISLILLSLEILYGLPSGSKERFFLPVMLILFIYSLRAKLPLIPVLISMALFVFFLFPFVGIYRNIFLTGNVLVDFEKTFNLYSEQFRHINLQTLNTLLFNIFNDRLNYSFVVSMVVDHTPAIWDFKFGYSYFLFIISLIPRIIWHGKPAISAFQNDFGRDYGFLSPVDYTTSIDMTWVGEMFMNFGWFGCIVGFLYGLFYQVLYTYYLRSGKLTSLTMLLYSLTLYYMLRGGTFAIQFSHLAKFYIMFFLIMYPFLKKVKV